MPIPSEDGDNGNSPTEIADTSNSAETEMPVAGETNVPEHIDNENSVVEGGFARTTQGVQVMTLKPKHRLAEVRTVEETSITNLPRYRCRTVPAAGALLREEDGEQMRLL